METSNDFQKYAKQRFSKLTTLNSVRVHQLLQSAQYAVLYALAGWILGTVVEHLMPEYDPEASASHMIWEVVGQAVLISVTIFYIRKIVKVIPYVFNNDKEFVPYQKEYAVPEYSGDMVLFISFIATQSNFLKRIKHLKLWLGEKMLGQDNKLEEAVDVNQVGATNNEEGRNMTSTPPNPPVRNGNMNSVVNGAVNGAVNGGNGNMNGAMNSNGMGPSLPPNYQSPNQVGMNGGNMGGGGAMGGGMNGGMGVMQSANTMANQNPSNYFTNQPDNGAMSTSFQNHTNLDSSVGQDIPDQSISGNGFAPMTSGSMDYSYIDVGEMNNGFDMQSGNMFY